VKPQAASGLGIGRRAKKRLQFMVSYNILNACHSGDGVILLVCATKL